MNIISYIKGLLIILQIYQFKMKYLLPQIILLIALLLGIASAASHPEAKLQFQQYCTHFKYPVQKHEVTTDDGYILTVFRIQKKNTNIVEGLKPILFQHGLLDSSDGWIINDQWRAPALMMANRGYDVWLGNSRGNKHSRKHIKYNPDKDKQFWQFTFQHMADYDLPAVFKYVYTNTKQKLHYIGHSQGTIQMFIALTKQNPVIQACMDKYFAFGPVAYIKNSKSHLVDLLDKSALLQWYHLRGIHEFMPSLSWFQSDAGVIFCGTFSKVCGDVMTQVMDGDPSLDNYERYDVLVGHDPSGTSVMNMAHWKQLLDTGRFQAYDYGSTRENQAHYGQAYPPAFNLQNIRVPVRLFAGASDLLADITDVDFMWKSLDEKAKKFYKIYNSGHLTFLLGIDVSPWMTDVVSMIDL